MESWQKEIKNILDKNPAVDRWLIRDFVWQETQPSAFPASTCLNFMVNGLALLLMGPIVWPDPEWRHWVKTAFIHAGLQPEMVDKLIDRLESENNYYSFWPRAGYSPITKEKMHEGSGDST